MFGSFRIRAIGGGPLRGARLFRSCELAGINAEEASFLVNDLHIASIYDIRNQWEVAANQEPYLVGTKMVALEPSTEHRRKDAQSRLVAGVIGEYGKPEAVSYTHLPPSTLAATRDAGVLQRSRANTRPPRPETRRHRTPPWKADCAPRQRKRRARWQDCPDEWPRPRAPP